MSYDPVRGAWGQIIALRGDLAETWVIRGLGILAQSIGYLRNVPVRVHT